MTYKYSIFETEWGYFGLFGTDNGVFRSCLPVDTKEKAREILLPLNAEVIVDNRCFHNAIKLVIDYYKGTYIDFISVKGVLDNKSLFTKAILLTLRNIKYGETVSYGQLAQMAGRPKAARAVGSVLAQNPIPLIIPCHRVIKANGQIGDFSGSGGMATKQKMLNLEAKGVFVNFNKNEPEREKP